MAKFFTYSNNGVTAVVSEETMQKIQWYEESRREAGEREQEFLAPYPTPIFTFSDAPGLQGVVTGTLRDKEELLRGHQTESRFFYVPFSNCGGSAELLYRDKLDGVSFELAFVTTLRQAMDAFGLVRAEEPVEA